jgi:alpha-glucosidase
LYWYDRPEGSPGKKGGAGDSDGFIKNIPDLEFYKMLPTIWDETKILEGETGKFATIARRSGNDWFLGSLTGGLKKSVQINFDFLKSGEQYDATIYSFDPDSESISKVKTEQLNVSSGTSLKFEITANSGLAIYLKKI